MAVNARRRATAQPHAGLVAGLARRVAHERAHAYRRLVRRGRYLHGILEGTRYRLAGRGPDPLAGDDVVAERVRSALGMVEKRLDVPRAHVMVTNHVATLHGEVVTVGEALTLAEAAGAVPGVLGVESRLHVGLLHGQGRPSQGRLRQRRPSAAMQYLLAVGARAGLGSDHATAAVRAVLQSFLACLPAAERHRLLACLPADLRRLAGGAGGWAPRTADPVDLVARVAEVSALDDMVRAERVTEGVLGALHEVLPSSRAARVGAALPSGLQPLWGLAGQAARARSWPLWRRVRVEVRPGEWRWRRTSPRSR